jgi:hypothetical protein
MKRTGQVLTVGELAREYGFTDTDGRQLPPFEMPPGRRRYAGARCVNLPTPLIISST